MEKELMQVQCDEGGRLTKKFYIGIFSSIESVLLFLELSLFN